MNDDRLIEVETRLAYHEDAIQSLSDTVARQQQRLDQLDQLCRQLVERLRTASETVHVGSVADEVPPHY